MEKTFEAAAGTFAPDLIVEVTTVCDRACPGCYSPTLRTHEDIEATHRSHPELFMSPETLDLAIVDLGERPDGMSLRGGEPSRHPRLAALIEVAARHTHRVWVETHARWLLGNNRFAAEWLSVLVRTGSIVKVSYDRMHSLSEPQLRAVVKALDEARVRWSVAITEPDSASFAATRRECAWIEDERVIFQHKVRDHRLLVEPRLGTIDVAGRHRARPTHKKALEVASA